MNMRRTLSGVLSIGVSLALGSSAIAALDHNGTPWMYMADGSDFPGYHNAHANNEVIDGDGTKINGWAYYGGGADWGADDPAVRWDVSTPAAGQISYDLATSPSGSGQFARIQGGRNGRGAIGATDWTPVTGFTAEWRMASHYPSNDNTGHIYMNINTGSGGGAKYGFQLTIQQNPQLGDGLHQIVDRYHPASASGRAIALPFATTDGQFHTYRLVLQPDATPSATGLADLYVDGQFIDTVYGLAVGNDTAMLFGRVSDGNYFGLMDADWDYVAIKPGATLPIPEPASLGLLMLSAAGLWRDRRSVRS